ncbi:DEAD/DEAH box helicase family protein [Candidatus Woesearchaeota archaeon]|nr:DEAD/DEAH box helicase family protein [Candidatus Woesearchaeota archaeon]
MPEYKIKFEPRLYQSSILETSTQKNTLIVLPTGLGKTKTAILVSLHRLNNFPNSRILFLTPTKPLVSQIANEYKSSSDLDSVKTFTGEISPEKRSQLWKSSKVIVSTPQTIANDIINKRISLKEVSLLVADEAHRATGDYDYCFIAKEYQKIADFPRIIALTASPGSNYESIINICKNLFIEDVEVRTESDEDVSPYIQEMDIDWIKVDLPEDFTTIKVLLEEILKERLQKLKEQKIISTLNVSKKELLASQARIHGMLAKGNKDYSLMRGISVIAETIKLQYAVELIETQSVNSLILYLDKIIKEAESGKIKASKSIAIDERFKTAYIKAKSLFESSIKHPKLTHLIELVKQEVAKDQKIKIIIFTQYRDSGSEIESILNKENIKSTLFVGQAKKNGVGLSQKKQIEILNNFRENKFNCLIGTSVSEEGIDIPKVDLVIFYEPIPSAIRSIQRKGRTARLEKGKVIILMTKNTRDETSHWVSINKEKNMNYVLKNLKTKLSKETLKNNTLENIQNNQTKLSLFSKASQEIKIIVDSRESNKHLHELNDKGINLETRKLEVADYLLSDKCAIELKTVPDFVASIIDKRILNQIRELRNNYEKPILLIEGQEDIYSVRKVHPNAIKGMLASIILDFNVPIIFTKNPRETAEFLMTIAKREQNELKKDFGVRIDKKPLTTKELQEFVIESLPGIGPTAAKSLLTQFETIKNIINASEDDLKKAENIGGKKAKDILDLINEKYH